MLDEMEWIWVIAAGVGSLAILGALSVVSLLFSAGPHRQGPLRGSEAPDARC